MDLSKAFDSIRHDLLIAKLAAYGFEEKTLLYIYSYLENRKQFAKINNIIGNFQTIASGVPQGSIVSTIYLIFSTIIFSFSCVMCLFIILSKIIPCQVLSRQDRK